MIYLPTLHSFAMENSFTGSCGLLRFKLTPQVVKSGSRELNMEESSILAQIWHGQFCLEKSEIEKEARFPMSEEGRSALLSFLEANVAQTKP